MEYISYTPLYFSLLFKKRSVYGTHYLPVIKLSTAVGCGHGGAAGLQVPGLVTILCSAGDGDGVDTAAVTIT